MIRVKVISTSNVPASSMTERAIAVPRLVSSAVIIARGKVWVLPVKLPANMMVAPNSERALAQARAIPVSKEGAARGKVIRRKVLQGDIPSVWEISSYSLGTDMNPSFAERT